MSAEKQKLKLQKRISALAESIRDAPALTTEGWTLLREIRHINEHEALNDYLKGLIQKINQIVRDNGVTDEDVLKSYDLLVIYRYFLKLRKSAPPYDTWDGYAYHGQEWRWKYIDRIKQLRYLRSLLDTQFKDTDGFKFVRDQIDETEEQLKRNTIEAIFNSIPPKSFRFVHYFAPSLKTYRTDKSDRGMTFPGEEIIEKARSQGLDNERTAEALVVPAAETLYKFLHGHDFANDGVNSDDVMNHLESLMKGYKEAFEDLQLKPEYIPITKDSVNKALETMYALESDYLESLNEKFKDKEMPAKKAKKAKRPMPEQITDEQFEAIFSNLGDEIEQANINNMTAEDAAKSNETVIKPPDSTEPEPEKEKPEPKQVKITLEKPKRKRATMQKVHEQDTKLSPIDAEVSIYQQLRDEINKAFEKIQDNAQIVIDKADKPALTMSKDKRTAYIAPRFKAKITFK